MNIEVRLKAIQDSSDEILTRITVLNEIIDDAEEKLRKNFKEEAALQALC